MASGQPPRLYISAMETDIAGLPRFDSLALGLLARLSDAGYIVVWQKKWREYEIIEREIATCDALLAVVDMAWTSSTWMASEVTWATGDFGAMETPNPHMKPIPIFLYPVAPDSPTRFPFNHRAPILLDRDVEKALAQVMEKLPTIAGSA